MVFASIGSKWESLYNKDVKNLKEGFFDVHFPAKYVAPGPDPAVTQIVAQVAIQLSPEEYARAKEDLARREKELAEAEKKVNKLKEEYDEEALEYAELRLKQAKAKRDEVQSKIKSADLWTEEQRLKKLKKTVKKPEPEIKEKKPKNPDNNNNNGSGMTSFIMRKIQEFFEGLLDKTS